MATCKKIRRTSKRVCIGALNRKVIIKVRSITPPVDCGVDFGESFTEAKEFWALVETMTGPQIFDDTNVQTVITHNIYIRYFSGFTSEGWLTLKSIDASPDVCMKIVDVENLGEENRFYKLRCVVRGDIEQPVNSA